MEACTTRCFAGVLRAANGRRERVSDFVAGKGVFLAGVAVFSGGAWVRCGGEAPFSGWGAGLGGGGGLLSSIGITSPKGSDSGSGGAEEIMNSWSVMDEITGPSGSTKKTWPHFPQRTLAPFVPSFEESIRKAAAQLSQDTVIPRTYDTLETVSLTLSL
jgi:hypothetical protein